MVGPAANGALACAVAACVLQWVCVRPAVGAVVSFRFGGAGPEGPVNKVVELLGVLGKQLKEDAAKDAAQYRKFKAWFEGEARDLRKVVAESQDLIKGATQDMEQEQAFIVSKRSKFEKAAAALAAAEKQLADAKEVRETERKTFMKNEAELIAAVDQFQRALEVLAKKKPEVSAFLEAPVVKPLSGVELLHLAQHLRKTLEGSGDLSMTDMQRETLSSFVRFAARNAREEQQRQRQGGQDGGGEARLDFLQVKSASGAKGNDAGLDIDGVAETLEGVLQKTQERLDAIRRNEATAQQNHGPFVDGLNEEIQSQQQAMQAMKLETAQHDQKIGELKSVILAGQEKLKVSQDDLVALQEDFGRRTKSFQARRQKREDEALAVKEARDILSRPEAQGAFKPPPALPSAAKADPFVSLVQVKQTSQLSLHSRVSGGPFGKVKKLVTDMLRKLEEEQAADQKHGQWCDKEMTKTKASQKQKAREVAKVTDRLQEMEAELGQLSTDRGAIQKELQDMTDAITKAEQLRAAESAQAKEVLASYAQGSRLVKAAIDALQKYYAQQEEAKAAAANEEHGYKPSGAGAQVIGILEVAREDYAKLSEEGSQAEIAAQKDFKKFMSEASVRKAVYEKDLEYKVRAGTKLQSERTRALEDLKNYEKEVEAVASYLSELEASCTVKGDSYEERRARREAELASLKEALAHLQGQSGALIEPMG